jgi:hypothetical protein
MPVNSSRGWLFGESAECGGGRACTSGLLAVPAGAEDNGPADGKGGS